MKNRLYSALCVVGITLFISGCNNIQGVKQDLDNGFRNNSVEYTNDLDKNKEIVVDGGDVSGNREPNVKVGIGFGDREYWAYTNEYGQLVRVEAKEIVLQDDNTEPVTAEGRYYSDEAKVPGVEQKDLDEGHIIADSLGGVSNAYNITPQDSTLNRHGDQAYMEDVIRDAGGCTDFVATITYPDTETQIPSHYNYTYVLKGNMVEDDFDNVNPDGTIPSDMAVGGSQTSVGSEDSTAVGNEDMVWVSGSGSKYHSRNDCGTMNSNNATQMSKSEAESNGMSPCKKCY